MGKRSRKEAETSEVASKVVSKSKTQALWSSKAVDPSLALLFSSSAGPVQAPPKSRYSEAPPPRKQNVEAESEDGSNAEAEDSEADEDLSSVDGDLEDADLDELSENEEESDNETQLERLLEAAQKPERKRKRKDQDEDLEGKYMQKLVEAEEKEEAERQAERRVKRQRITATQKDGSGDENGENEEENEAKSGSDEESDDEMDETDETAPTMRVAPSDVPLHESLGPDTNVSEIEKASRTVFLANVCSSAISSKAANKTLLKHMSSFIEDLPTPPEGKPAHKVESLRFRSTAFATLSLPKKAAFAKKDIRVATTKSTNAYVVYSTAYAAREAVKKLNGTVVLDRHLRVDGVAHPAKTDHKRCVFVGNLGFVDDESMVDQNGENERKRSKIPSDIEEGLWRQFGKAGTVESVRVVRDEKTRVGKGFAYVQFVDPNSVEAALLFHDKMYPPMLPRKLRVVRAKPAKKTALAFAASRDSGKKSQPTDKNRIYNPKITSEASSLHGRAGRMLGKAGAAKLKNSEGSGANTMPVGARGSAIEGIAKTPEKIIFEGHRALRTGKPKDLKGKKGSGKPKTKSSKRAASWKKSGGKK